MVDGILRLSDQRDADCETELDFELAFFVAKELLLAEP
jgi:hypothetical protein